MNNIKEYEHQIILNDWENFPYKLDYLIHLVSYNNEKTYDVFLKNNNDNYQLAKTTNISTEHFDYNKLCIKKDQLFDYLNINSLTSLVASEFTYTTQIFADRYKLKGQLYFNKTGNGLAFRILEIPKEIKFNEKLENYFLAHQLNHDLEMNKLNKKKPKI